jgi:hypothetical protein
LTTVLCERLKKGRSVLKRDSKKIIKDSKITSLRYSKWSPLSPLLSIKTSGANVMKNFLCSNKKAKKAFVLGRMFQSGQTFAGKAGAYSWGSLERSYSVMI